MKTTREYRMEDDSGMELIQYEPFIEEYSDISDDYLVEDYGIVSWERIRHIFFEEIDHGILFYYEDCGKNKLQLNLVTKCLYYIDFDTKEERTDIEVYLNNELFYYGSVMTKSDYLKAGYDITIESRYHENEQMMVYLKILRCEIMNSILIKEIKHYQYKKLITHIINSNTTMISNCIDETISFL